MWYCGDSSIYLLVKVQFRNISKLYEDVGDDLYVFGCRESAAFIAFSLCVLPCIFQFLPGGSWPV